MSDPADSGTRPACCDLHNANCEPPSELCCRRCAEVSHPRHPAGVACVVGGAVTPLGRLFLAVGGPVGEPQPGDDELGRALVAQWGEQIVARCGNWRDLVERIGPA